MALTAESKEQLKSLLMRVKEESEKAGLKLSIKKQRSWLPITSLHGKQRGKKVGAVTSSALKSPRMVNWSQKWEDDHFLAGKLWQTSTVY